ncbi:MAG: bifunctional nuclease domain-containing protein, partial [Candidatus Limnocylindrales bacterium]
GREMEIDARPSDALALAVRTGAEVFADAAVLDRAGVEPEEKSEEKLEVFREFINSLDMDLGEGPREGPREGPPRE